MGKRSPNLKLSPFRGGTSYPTTTCVAPEGAGSYSRPISHPRLPLWANMFTECPDSLPPWVSMFTDCSRRLIPRLKARRAKHVSPRRKPWEKGRSTHKSAPSGAAQFTALPGWRHERPHDDQAAPSTLPQRSSFDDAALARRCKRLPSPARIR